MTITPQSHTTTQYRRGHELICAVEPGRIVIHVFGLYSQLEVEEYIGALHRAAKEAQLPTEKPDNDNPEWGGVHVEPR